MSRPAFEQFTAQPAQPAGDFAMQLPMGSNGESTGDGVSMHAVPFTLFL